MPKKAARATPLRGNAAGARRETPDQPRTGCCAWACAASFALVAVFTGLLFNGALARFGLFRAIGAFWPRFSGLTPAFARLPWSCTHEEVAALTLPGQLALITGASSGLGLEAAKVIARAGASVALACRSAERCAAAAAAVRAEAAPGAVVSSWALDTSSLASVRAFAAEFTLAHPTRPLDMLLLNAGVASAGAWAPGAPSLPLSVDGIEAVMATNHVGHALLFQMLLPRLLAARTSRVVLTSSASSFDTYKYGVATDLETLNSPPERGVAAALNPYGQSKLAQILWAQEAAAMLEKEGHLHVFVNSMHPGSVDTNIWPCVRKQPLACSRALDFNPPSPLPLFAAPTPCLATA